MKTKRIQILITLSALLIAGAHLVWPSLTIDGITLVLIVIAIVPWLAPLFKSVEFPGGWKIEFQDLQMAKDKVDKVGLLSNAVNREQIPQYPFLLVSDEDPNLALAGLRIEIEKRLLKLAEKQGVRLQRASVGTLLRVLSQKEVLTQQESSVLADMVGLLNAAVHGAQVDRRATDWAMDVGPRLLASLDERISKDER